MNMKKTHSRKHQTGHNPAFNTSNNYLSFHLHTQHPHKVSLFFNLFAKRISDIVGNAWSFILALVIVIGWGITGPIFKYSNTWQLLINTGTTIITFLIIFLIQNTQNRDTEIINLKLDELIRAHKGARNDVINLADLSDEELKNLEQEYIKLKGKRTGV
jgi:low affinity Fe/Cu permease